MTGDNGNSVVDATILETELSTGVPAIPSFLQRTHETPEDHATQVDAVQQVTEQPEHAPAAGGNLSHDNSDNGAPMSREDMVKEFNKDVASFGKDSGKGSAALPRLGLRVIRAAADGLISTEKPKDGSKSDAVRIYDAYAANDSKHAEHTNGGMKANAAKLNALIGLGTMTTCDGVAVADRAVKLREEMEGAELKPKALFAGLVDVARSQMESDVELTDEAIKEALTKTPADKTLEKEWAAIQKRVDTLISGEGTHGLKDQSDAALKIGELIKEHVTQFVSKTDDVEMVLALMEKGHARSAAEEVVRPGVDAGWSI